MKSSLKFCFLLLLPLFVFLLQEAQAQEFSIALSEAVPQVEEKLNSEVVKQRISVLQAIVVKKKSGDVVQLILPFELSQTDYSFVVRKILEKDLLLIDDDLSSETFWKIKFVVEKFQLREFARPLADYLERFEKSEKRWDIKGGEQLGILYVLNTLKAKECDSQIFAMLQSSSENVRREALSTLVEIGSKKAVPVLIEQLKDKNYRYYAVQNLVKLDAKESAPEIAKLLKVDDINIKHAALMALVSLNAREQTLEIWNLVSDEQLKSLATAALIYLADERAIRWFSQQIAVDRQFTESVLGHAGTLKARPIIPALVAILEKGKLSDDRYFDSTVRRNIINCLGNLEAKEAIPVLRKYVRTETSFQKWDAIQVLGELQAKEAVDDLIFVLSRALNGYNDKGYGTYGDDYHTIRTAGIALAKIADKKAWNVLIETAGHPKFEYGSEVISGLNRYLDSELWEKAKTQKVNAGAYKSIKYVGELASRETRIPVILELEKEDFTLRNPQDWTLENTNGYPWLTTDEKTTLFDIVRLMPIMIKEQTVAEKYTYIFDNGTIRILPLKKAVEWWKNKILTK